MKKGKNAAEILDSDGELDDIELSDGRYQKRTLVFKAAPPSMRRQLMAHGAIEIRCTCCNQIKPLVGAEESEEGWICEDCVPEMRHESQYGGQKRR
jgi:LSD1 subclass zinc finger protein